jgi:acyl-CoA reductase-like NAD-dependent aldehyde dehydrogenase
MPESLVARQNGPGVAGEPLDHPFLLAGEPGDVGVWAEVRSPYDGSLVGRVAIADLATVDAAARAGREAVDTGRFPQHERAEVLARAATIVTARSEEMARLLALEVGKPIKAARTEVRRCADTLAFSAAEARKLSGTVVPMDASPSAAGRVAFTLRVPCGVVAAISPFNFPLNLVAHKLGPAIAAGNAVILKPAEQAPIAGLLLARVLLEAGLPPAWISVLPGDGPETGRALVDHPLVDAISFTGSAAVGWQIRSSAPTKKVLLELGSNAPLIVHEDGNWEAAAAATALHAFSFAGQACISVQRILVHDAVAEMFLERLRDEIEGLQVGDPLYPETDVGPLISDRDRDRVGAWIEECVVAGGELLCGGRLVDQGRCLEPTVVGSPPRDSKLWREEAFGPVATFDTYSDLGEAIELANDSRFGLQAGVYTKDLGRALRVAQELHYGGVLINDVPTFRADQQPYGGVKESGNTREGPAFAVRELTEERFVSLQA